MNTFSILRTNVGLTSNIKVVVSKSGETYLESIDSNSILSDNRFKKYKFNKENYWDISKIRESKWKKDLANVDVEYRPIHKTRSTFISTLISNGEDINYVSKIAGHKTVRMTLDKYSKYISHTHKEFGKCFI